jgi:hypothetical protein
MLGSTLTATIGLVLALQPGQGRGIQDKLLCPADGEPRRAAPAEPAVPESDKTPAAKAAPAPVVISIGQTVRLQMRSKRPITSVFVDREGIVQVQPDPADQTTIRVTGLAAGVARIHLTDAGGKTEIHQWGRSR